MSYDFPYFDFAHNDRPAIVAEPSGVPTPSLDGWYCLVEYVQDDLAPQLMCCAGDLSKALYAQGGRWLWPLILPVPEQISAGMLRACIFTALETAHGVVSLDFQAYPKPTLSYLTEALEGLYVELGTRACDLRAAQLTPGPWGADGLGAWQQAKHAALDQAFAAWDQTQSA